MGRKKYTLEFINACAIPLEPVIRWNIAPNLAEIPAKAEAVEPAQQSRFG